MNAAFTCARMDKAMYDVQPTDSMRYDDKGNTDTTTAL